MDEDLLRAKGLHPKGAELAFVDGLALRIGQRAALVAMPGVRVHSLVLSLTLCYNLSQPPAPTERNPECATKLRAVAEKVGIPAEYVASLQ
jgi:hypothetical protein